MIGEDPLPPWLELSGRGREADVLKEPWPRWSRAGTGPRGLSGGAPDGPAGLRRGKLRDELLDREVFDTLLEAKVLIGRWRKAYNIVRPHSSLGYRPPAPESRRPCPLDSATPHQAEVEADKFRCGSSHHARGAARVSSFGGPGKCRRLWRNHQATSASANPGTIHRATAFGGWTPITNRAKPPTREIAASGR